MKRKRNKPEKTSKKKLTVTGLFHLNFRQKLGRMQKREGKRKERGRAMSATDLTTSFVWVIKIAQLAGVDFRTGHAYTQISHTHKHTHTYGAPLRRAVCGMRPFGPRRN